MPVGNSRRPVTLLVALFFVAGAARGEGPKPAPSPTFERDVLPILSARCLKCHGARKRKAGLDLRTPAGMSRGGDNGPVLVQGSSRRSPLFKKISTGEMPPGKTKLTQAQVRTLRDWINAGAPAAQRSARPSAVTEEDRSHWAFRPPIRPAVPAVRHEDRVRTPADAFLLARLEVKGLTFAPEADRATLLRRASLDLLGLPPSPQDLDAFLADNRPGAYERLLDRLLASPHFGERWGRHWLDVAGYTDTVGFDQDSGNIIQSEGKWRYRDYVIGAFNQDLSYDRFVTEQLAGDELVDWRHAPRFTPEIRRLLTATGYLRTARDQTHEDVGEIPLNYYGVLHDTVAIVGNSLLGLTLHCAQCHSHKFDPIPQRDYYQLMALFTPAYNPGNWRSVTSWGKGVKDRSLPDVSAAELAEFDRHNRAVDRRVAELNARLQALRRPHEMRLREARLRAVPEPIRADTRDAVATPAAKRTEVQKYLAAKFEAALRITAEQVAAVLSSAERSEVDQINARVASLKASRRVPGKIQALFDVGPAPPSYLLKRGNYETPGEAVAPGFLSVLTDPARPDLVPARQPFPGTSGRRLALARWLTEPGSRAAALLARVMVNRLWQHLFGQGLAPTPENVGRSGEPPTDRELLDWLASEFAGTGWRVKPMLKLMMMSTAYRQASRPAPGEGSASQEAADPGNRLLWRMRLRRLEAEAIRDSLLAVSGRLDMTMGGPPVIVRARPDGLVEIDAKAPSGGQGNAAAGKRSVYLLCRRSYNLSLLTVFDQPLVAQNCPCRDVSAVPLQSLTMLNDAFVAEQARHLAERVRAAAGLSGERAIRTAFRLALARPPTGAETAICARLLRRQADAYREAGQAASEAERHALVQLCHTLLNTSEFLYVE